MSVYGYQRLTQDAMCTTGRVVGAGYVEAGASTADIQHGMNVSIPPFCVQITPHTLMSAAGITEFAVTGSSSSTFTVSVDGPTTRRWRFGFAVDLLWRVNGPDGTHDLGSHVRTLSNGQSILQFDLNGTRSAGEFRIFELTDLPTATWDIDASTAGSPPVTTVTCTRSASVSGGPLLFLVSADGRLLTS